jgi:hypothetical protein
MGGGQNTQVFVTLPGYPSRIVHLTVGDEWHHFCNWMLMEFEERKWSAYINGKLWEGNSWAPSRDQTIRINFRTQGGKKDQRRVWIKFEDVEEMSRVWLPQKKKDCFAGLRNKFEEEFGRNHWVAMLDGNPWIDDLRMPDEGNAIVIEVEPGFPGPGPDPTAPVPPRMIHYGNPDAADPYSATLLSLDEVLSAAQPYPNWVLTHAEAKLNAQALMAYGFGIH